MTSRLRHVCTLAFLIIGHSGFSRAQFDIRPRIVPAAWQLGVSSRNLREGEGVEILRVTRGSSAEQARLEPGDIIVAVNRKPVGNHRGKLYDLGDVLNAEADTYGRVLLSVRDLRSKSVVSVPVKLIDRNAPTPPSSQGPSYPPNLPGRPPYGSGRPPNVTLPPDYRPGNRPGYRPDYQPGNRPGYPFWPPQGGLGDEREINQLFLQYLGRPAKADEIRGWVSNLANGSTLSEVRVGLLSSSEFFDLCRNDRQILVRSLFLLMEDRQPTQQEFTAWRDRFDRDYRRDRVRFVRDFLIEFGKY